MQEFRNEELVKTEISEDGKFTEMDEGSTHRVIGTIPKKGDILKINGLLFEVRLADFIKGKFTATIVKPTKAEMSL